MVDVPAPEVEVGIVKAERIRFYFEGSFFRQGGDQPLMGFAEAYPSNGSIGILHGGRTMHAGKSITFKPGESSTSRFVIKDVVIGIGFHWEQKEVQEFQGALKLVHSGGRIQVVNLISVEDYLASVISSEMRGDSAPALLKAHAIISRSWLLAQIFKKDTLLEEESPYELIHQTEDEYMRWYDREDHEEFHVCADDHCQRYQGTTRVLNPEVVKAVTETAGEVLVYKGNICDARFSKCCGGVSEEFEYCWEPVSHPYLKRVCDNPGSEPVKTTDLKIELNAVQFITGAPEAFCNTTDEALLRQVLNDYDQSSKDFYRWTVTYAQDEIAALIREKSGIDFGDIVDLIPAERGESGRLVRLKVVGTRKTLTIGKELEIRRWLSKSHLYSAAIVIEKMQVHSNVPEGFILHGAGWGHGVGLCQIGAAVMAGKGYVHEEILTHYFTDATIERRYEPG